MSFGSSFGSNPLSRMMSSVPVVAQSERPAEGPTGAYVSVNSDEESDDVPDVPLTFDQETNLLVRMNEQQSKTICELQERIARLEKELVEKPIAPVCYIKCAHCAEQDRS